MPLYRDHGIVLRTWKLGESDRIVSLCTRNRGKVRAVAKGVRKTKSRFGARLEPTSHVAMQLYEGRELDIVTQAESVDQFPVFRTDFERFRGASAMLETVDHVVQEGEPNPQVYHSLLGALRALAGRGGKLVAPAFFLKVLAMEGHRPVLEVCVECGEDDPGRLVAFDAFAGGTLCPSCRRGSRLTPQARELMLQILGGELGAALNAPESSTTVEVTHLATGAMETYLERRLRSLSVAGL